MSYHCLLLISDVEVVYMSVSPSILKLLWLCVVCKLCFVCLSWLGCAIKTVCLYLSKKQNAMMVLYQVITLHFCRLCIEWLRKRKQIVNWINWMKQMVFREIQSCVAAILNNAMDWELNPPGISKCYLVMCQRGI